MCDYFTSTILLTTDFCGSIPRATIKTMNLMQWHGTICIVKVFLLSEREISPNYKGNFLDFVHRFGSYVKGLPKTKRCNSVAVTVSVQIRCICETALKVSCQFIIGFFSIEHFYLFSNWNKKLNHFSWVNCIDQDLFIFQIFSKLARSGYQDPELTCPNHDFTSTGTIGTCLNCRALAG